MHEFTPLTVQKDHARILDLCQRASDYIQLETGREPDADYVSNTLMAAPPQLTPDDVFLIGIARPDGKLAGLVSYIRHFYERDEWYMGLLLLDPAERGQSLGTRAANQVFDHARRETGTLIRIAVLEANPRARKFWESLGFEPERFVPAKQNDDGLARTVLKKRL